MLGRTVRELLATMDAQEWQHWIHVYNESPWGESRADLRAGIVAANVANYAGKVLKEGARVTPADYMPYLKKEPEEEKPKQSEQDKLAAVQYIVTALGVASKR